MNQIPNLSAGLIVTDDEGSDNGAWYVADGTGKDDDNTTMSGREKSSSTKASQIYHNYQSSDRITNVGVMPISVTQTNKDALRSAFNNATNIVAKYGLKPDGTSIYYNSSNSNWTKFVNLYKVAGKMLAKLDLASTTSVSGYTLSTAVSNLNSAIAAIESEAKITSTATARFLALSKTANGYKLINVQDV